MVDFPPLLKNRLAFATSCLLFCTSVPFEKGARARGGRRRCKVCVGGRGGGWGAVELNATSLLSYEEAQ